MVCVCVLIPKKHSETKTKNCQEFKNPPKLLPKLIRAGSVDQAESASN